ncbi:MAG TPA: LytTR family DNA-binding domain-containing protein [Pyrinomonadaceae bacterium]|nr:LytTR family DNA-binding domain-containing protein [Pyrinomonadaceae bacterium]
MDGNDKIRALIVDDEAAARRRIKQFLGELPDVEVVGECEDGCEAVAHIERCPPDLLFLDIQMQRLGGFDVIERVGAERVPAVIFVTAYDEFALRAFEVCALDYLLKPLDRGRFQSAVERARTQIQNSRAAGLDLRLQRLLGELHSEARRRRVSRLEVRSCGRTVFVRVEKIDWVGAADNYLELHAGNETHLIRETMSQLEARLDPSMFVRVHRSTLVNLERIQELRPLFNRDHLLVLRDGTQLTVSRTHYEHLLSRLRGD